MLKQLAGNSFAFHIDHYNYKSFGYHSIKSFHGSFGRRLEEPLKEVDKSHFEMVSVREVTSHVQLIDDDNRYLPERNVFTHLNKFIHHLYTILLRIPQQLPEVTNGRPVILLLNERLPVFKIVLKSEFVGLSHQKRRNYGSIDETIEQLNRKYLQWLDFLHRKVKEGSFDIQEATVGYVFMYFEICIFRADSYDSLFEEDRFERISVSCRLHVFFGLLNLSLKHAFYPISKAGLQICHLVDITAQFFHDSVRPFITYFDDTYCSLLHSHKFILFNVSL